MKKIPTDFNQKLGENNPLSYNNFDALAEYLLKLTTSMPFDTAALHIAEPTKPLPPKTTICYKQTNTQIMRN